MAIKKFVIEFEDDHACAVSRLDLWRALREHFVEDLYISVNEICPTKRAVEVANCPVCGEPKAAAALHEFCYPPEPAPPVI